MGCCLSILVKKSSNKKTCQEEKNLPIENGQQIVSSTTNTSVGVSDLQTQKSNDSPALFRIASQSKWSLNGMNNLENQLKKQIVTLKEHNRDSINQNITEQIMLNVIENSYDSTNDADADDEDEDENKQDHVRLISNENIDKWNEKDVEELTDEYLKALKKIYT